MPAHSSFGYSVKDIELGSVPFTVGHLMLMIVHQNSNVISANKSGYF